VDINITLNQIKELSINDRIRLVQAIWDSIAEEQAFPDLTPEQSEELDRRSAAYDADPTTVMTWEEVKASIKSKA
jgi:putative addiction module component (TIGR02574 family)